MKIVFLRSIIAAFHHTCRSCCPFPKCPSPRECMQSIHSPQLFPQISVAGRSVESIRRTVKGSHRSVHAPTRPQADLLSRGSIKVIKTSLERAICMSFANSRGRQRDQRHSPLFSAAGGTICPALHGAFIRIFSGRTVKGNDE